MESLRVLIQEKMLPDINRIKEQNSQIVTSLDLTNKRLDDVNKRLDDLNTHLADQSRRIDDVRSELCERIDKVRAELKGEIIDLNYRMQEIHRDLILRFDKINARIDGFFESCAKENDVVRLETRLHMLEGEVKEIKQQMAA